jgi:uncharacterized protein (TIGR03435 family)
MTGEVARNLDPGRKLLLALAATVAISVPLSSAWCISSKPMLKARAENRRWSLRAPGSVRFTPAWICAGSSRYPRPRAAGTKESSTPSTSPKPFSGYQDHAGRREREDFLADMGAVFEGKLSPDGMSIAGTLNQFSFTHPLVLNRATPETAWKIPKPEEPMAANADPSFVNATIKPSNPKDSSRGFAIQFGHLAIANITLSDLFSLAYAINPKQIVGAPAWIYTDKFDIAAQVNAAGMPNDQQLQSMLRKLLADRFHVNHHHETRELAVYALSAAGSGPKLVRSAADPKQSPNLLLQAPGKLKVGNGSIQNLTTLMQSVVLDRPVLDRTGIKGRYDFTLNWTPDDSQFPGLGMTISHPTGAAAPPPLSTAIQQQIGLKLEATRAPIEALVIDHVEKPQERN